MDHHGQTVSVKIYNQQYSIRANDGNIERTRALAALVDHRMREIAKGALTADSLKVAILAAIHIADELDKANQKFDDLNRTITSHSHEFSALLDQVLKDK
ncbi:MAG: cell division protein ZapA [Blastocatellales bacterium]